MKKLQNKRTKKLMIMALSAIAIIFTICILTDPTAGLSMLAIAPIVVGGVTLEGKEAETYTAIMASIKSEVEKYNKDYISKTHLEEFVNEKIKELNIDIKDNEDFKKLFESLKAQGLEITALKDKGTGSDKTKSLRDQIKEQLEGRKEEWADFCSGKYKNFTFKIDTKAAGTMLISTNITGTGLPVPQVLPGLEGIPEKQPMIIPLCNYGPATSPSIQWSEKKNKDGNATVVNDSTIAPLIDFDIEVNTSNSGDYAARMKVHANMLSDIDYMVTEIQNSLRYDCDIVADDAALAYIISKASAFNLTTSKKKEPNFFDAIASAATQVIAASGRPNLAIMNPIDYDNMLGAKGSNGQYVMPPFSTTDGTRVAGLTIVQSTQVTSGNVLVGDFTKANVREIGSMEVSAGWENEDFGKRLTTFLGVRRLHFFIKDNHTALFVYDA
ncbi:MAG TPA: phage major capsid protein, partial [Bacteroidales bacterium]|nr:phage major capsid protein [Bacteroidales bacterium]